MAKKVALLAVDPVNGYGLFNYLESFYENGIPYTVFAVAETKNIRTNSGIAMTADDVVANLKGRSGDYDALVFACGDAIPKFGENASKQYNLDMMEVIKEFAAAGKIMAGHCAAGMMFDAAGILDGRTVAAHPYARTAIKASTTDAPWHADGNFYTAETENTVAGMMPSLIEALK